MSSNARTIRIAEIFYSLQGEASTSGWPTIFIRTGGCNLRCAYCDTAFAWEGGEALEIEEIIAAVREYPCQRVLITGGEPLLQREALSELARALLAEKYSLSLETNGSLAIDPFPAGVTRIIDVKTPGSGMSGVNNYENLRQARRHRDEFKFVIAEKGDFAWVLDIVRRYKLDRRYTCHLSPVETVEKAEKVEEKVSREWLAEQILASGLDLRLNLQLHKLIWPRESRGR